MSKLRISAWVALALMVSTLAGAMAWKPRIFLADRLVKVDLESMFPRSFGDWVVDERMAVQLISPDQAAVLNAIYSQTLSRTYVNQQGDRIMLSVAYGGDQSDATRAHRPEVCYPAQGFQMLSSEDGQLVAAGKSLPVRRLVTRLGGRVEPITYWIAVGNKVALTGTQQKVAQLSYGFSGLIPDGMLVRVSNIDADIGKGHATQARFIAQLGGAMPDTARARVFGGRPPDDARS